MTSSLATPPPIRWTDAYLLGYGPMDRVHEEFVTLVAQLQGADPSNALARLDAFAAHATDHFGTEDRWMTETEFPARDCHIDEHAAVLQSVTQVRALVLQGRTELVQSLADELARWFPGHADYLDSALSHWMCKRSLGGKPVVVRRNLELR